MTSGSGYQRALVLQYDAGASWDSIPPAGLLMRPEPGLNSLLIRLSVTFVSLFYISFCLHPLPRGLRSQPWKQMGRGHSASLKCILRILLWSG